MENNPQTGNVNPERRRYPRFYLDLPVTYYETDSSVRHNARAINASEGGFMIYFRENIEVGQDLRTNLSFLADSKLNSIHMKTKVIWKEIVWDTGWGDYRCGVKLIDISHEDMSKLKRFLTNASQ